MEHTLTKNSPVEIDEETFQQKDKGIFHNTELYNCLYEEYNKLIEENLKQLKNLVSGTNKSSHIKNLDQ